MTPLREQLGQARDVYEAARYPGDLAAEVLPTGGQRLLRSLPALLGGALAASIAVAIGFQGDRPSPSPAPLTAGQAQIDQSPRPVAVAYSFPDRMPLTLPTSPLLPAMPVTVSWAELNTLGQQQYEQIAPKLRQHLTLPGFIPARPDVVPGATTQQAV
jgi:hypothetical protein